MVDHANPGQEVALYYPHMVPPGRWLRHALLMYDEVSSIVHPEVLPALLTEANARMADAAGRELAWLIDEGAWRPRPVGRISHQHTYLREVREALETFASDPLYEFGQTSFPPAGELARLYVGKLDHNVEEELLRLRLAKLGRFGGHVMVHRDVGAMVLAITAKYLAAEDRDLDVRTVLGTDQTEHYRRAFGDLGSQMDSYWSRELILSGLAPVPEDSVTFQEVIHFRRMHADELLAFRAEVDRLVERTRASDAPLDEIRAARRDVEIAVNALRAAARSTRFRLLSGSLTLASAGLAAAAVPSGTVDWGFSGLGASAAVLLIDRMTRRPEPRATSPYTYLLRARAEYD